MHMLDIDTSSNNIELMPEDDVLPFRNEYSYKQVKHIF